MFYYVCGYIVIFQALFFLALTVSTYQLISKLKRIETTCATVSFKNEKLNVLVTVAVFDFFAAFRILLGVTVIPKIYSGGIYSPFVDLEVSLIICSIMDLTPLIFVMLLHHSNFKRQATLRYTT